LGLEHLTIALETRENKKSLKSLDLSENDLGPKNFELLLRVFAHNIALEEINVADSKIDTRCTVELCHILEKTNENIRKLYFRNSKVGDEGAIAVASLI
jgi:Leucine Rich repeat